MTRARLVLVVVLVLVAAGLGWLVLSRRPAPSGADTPQAAVETFYRALGGRDTATACAMSAYAGRPLAGDDLVLCRSGFDAVVAQVAEADELAALRSTTVSGASVDGDHASVRADQMTGVPTAYRRDVSLVRVDGHWFIDTPG